MRITGGKLKGRVTETPYGKMAIRPAMDKMRESVFNIIGFSLEGKSFLDLFSGSGTIALEAVSHGASAVTLCEMDKSKAKTILKNVKMAEEVGVRINCRFMSVEVTADSAGEWSYVFDNLPLQSVDENGILTGTTYKYYVTEVGINQNNSMSGYDVSYVFKDINGTQITKTDANVAPGSANAIESGTVEITNKLIEYELPETGGSGNRWLYMLSGVVLIAIATITLFYKKHKTL